MPIKVTGAPATTPETVANAKIHARVTTSDDDAFFTQLLKAAALEAQDFANISLITQTITATWDCFPSGREIWLPRPPLQSVTSVKYYDSSNTQVTLSSSSYQVDISTTPGAIVLNDGESWPVTYNRASAVEVIYIAGYGADESSVPEDIRLAIQALVTHWYDHRGVVETAPGLTQIKTPKAFDYTMLKYRVHGARGLE